MTFGRAAIVALTLVGLSQAADAQDSAIVRHVLPLDIASMRPVRRTYDVLVHARDSTMTIGSRIVEVTSATYAGALAWLLVETRSGLVPATESLYLATDLRPLHWSSTLGRARLAAEFTGDSIYGATAFPGGRQNIVLQGRPDMMVSAAMTEALIPLLPLAPAWADSLGVLAIDARTSVLLPAEITVVGEEDFKVDTSTYRASWVVVLRGAAHHVIYWIEKSTGAPLTIVQPLPAHTGTILEFRARANPPTDASPPLK